VGEEKGVVWVVVRFDGETVQGDPNEFSLLCFGELERGETVARMRKVLSGDERVSVSLERRRRCSE
jgi:hypothetical protein